MALSKIQSESMNLADSYAFTGTITGAGGGNLIHLTTTTVTAAESVAYIDFTSMDSTVYTDYLIRFRGLPAVDNGFLNYYFLDSSGSTITGTNYYQYGTTLYAYGRIANGGVGSVGTDEIGFYCTSYVNIKTSSTNTDIAPCVHSHFGYTNAGGSGADSDTFSHKHPAFDKTQPEGIRLYWDTGNLGNTQAQLFAFDNSTWS
ncbi:hypothetical protein OAV41_02145 [Planctomycetota bacterium]|nr:hypothetical protein [Planctomycetota bacterium]